MKTVTQMLRESKSLNISEEMLKSIEVVEYLNMAEAYDSGTPKVLFEDWYQRNFHK